MSVEIFTNLLYDHDTELVVESEKALRETADLVNIESAKKGLKMNVKKNKTRVVCRSTEEPQIKISVHSTSLEQVKQLKYFGQPITEDGKADTEIRRRIEKACQNFMDKKDMLTTRRLLRNQEKAGWMLHHNYLPIMRAKYRQCQRQHGPR